MSEGFTKLLFDKIGLQGLLALLATTSYLEVQKFLGIVHDPSYGLKDSMLISLYISIPVVSVIFICFGNKNTEVDPLNWLRSASFLFAIFNFIISIVGGGGLGHLQLL